MSLDVAKSAFLEGYRLARRSEAGPAPADLLEALTRLGFERTPFAVEGAAMACALGDLHGGRAPATHLLDRALGPLRPFVLLGVGCALARLGLAPPEEPTTLDGFGFQWGLATGISGPPIPGARPRADRGRGRALWFVTGGDANAVYRVIHRSRNAHELWRGVGTACTFAGDPRDHAPLLATLAGERAAAVAAGSDDALRLWRSLGHPPPRAIRVASTLSV